MALEQACLEQASSISIKCNLIFSNDKKNVEFPKEIAAALKEDPSMKKYLEKRKLPPKNAILQFLVSQPALPTGKNWKFVKVRIF